jgi:hypothetical protein
MQTGTAIGLLVGGAVLLLAASPRIPAGQTLATAPPAPGGNANPWNWLRSLTAPAAAAPFQPGQAPAYGAQLYNPQLSMPVPSVGGGFQNVGYGGTSPYYSPAYGAGNYGDQNYGGGGSIPVNLGGSGAYASGYSPINWSSADMYSPAYSPLVGSPSYSPAMISLQPWSGAANPGYYV